MKDESQSSGSVSLAESPEESLKRAKAAELAEQGELAGAGGESREKADNSLQPALVIPSPFLLGAIAGIVSKGVDASKNFGFTAPAAPEVGLTEEKWKELVSQNMAVVIARRFPAINDNSSEEFALAVLVLPWLITNLAGMFWKSRTAAKTEEKGKVAAIVRAAVGDWR